MKLLILTTTTFILGWLCLAWFFYSFDMTQSKAQNPPPLIVKAVMSDIDLICKGYPYGLGQNQTDDWYRYQQEAWERQGQGYIIPTIEKLNKFCKEHE